MIEVKGGRPAKKKYSARSRPAAEGGTHVYGNDAHSPGERDSTCIDSDSSIRSGMNLSSEEVFRRALPSYKTPDRELSLDRFVFCCDEIVCSICHLVVDQAVEARCCQKLFCASCICFWLDTHCTCPLCKSRLMADELAQPHPLVVGIISKCIVMCDFSESALVGCPVRVPLAELTSHVSSVCVGSTLQLRVRHSNVLLNQPPPLGICCLHRLRNCGARCLTKF